MSTDKILNVKTTLPDTGGASLSLLTDDLSVGLGTGNAGGDGLGSNPGASLLALGDDGSTGTVHLGAPSLGLADTPVTPHYYAAPSKPISIGFLPQTPASDGSDGSLGTLATFPTVALFGDFGGDFSPSGGAAIDVFAKSGSGGSGGPGGGGSGGGVVAQYFSGSANGNAGFDIWIDFKGTGWTTDLMGAFRNSADYLTTVITDDIGGGGLYHGKVIDDLYITAELKAIDGTGGVLGQSGPTALWSATELPAAGQMQFDVADAATYLNQGLWDDIVDHEMMHTLGFGSLWNYGANPLVSGDKYTGAAGLEAYRTTFDSLAQYIPVETDGGSGTAGAHWDEQALGNELMTGYINDTNYLSKFSVVSLADLGYHVNYQDYPYDNVVIA
jgi:hypothetical protein